MKEIEIELVNPSGLHARPAKVLVNLAKQFQSNIFVFLGGKKANAKSMVSVLTLGAVAGSKVTLQTEGADEDTALEQLVAAFRAGLGDFESHSESQPVKQPETVTVTQAQPARVQPVAVEPARAGAGNRLRGVAAAPGIAVGSLFQYRPASAALEDASLLTQQAKMSLSEALDCARKQLAELSQQMKQKNLASEAGIFEAHIELLDDPELMEAIEKQVAGGANLPQAWKAEIDERATSIAALPDPLLAGRANDLRDVGTRVLRLLLGSPEKTVVLPSSPVILIARELSPSDTASFEAGSVLGFCLVEGGPTSHVAILARALSLPAVVGASEAVLSLSDGSPVILNGNDGTLTVNPDEEARSSAVRAQQRWVEQRQAAQSQADQPAVTVDGHHVDVTANAGSIKDAVEAVKKGADGIGLLRTEFLFLERSVGPSEQEQFDVYRAIAETMNPRPVIIRTLDIGGDKPLPYIQLRPEMNPFLGERGIRLCLNRPELFREQLRAILRASTAGILRIMFPMVSDLDEIRQARRMVEELRQELGTPPIQIGIMIEVPSAALLAEKLAPEIDFFSIGTNDLTQYTLAIDRAHPALAARHDGLHPSVLRLIAQTVNGAHQFGKRADLCGELGSDPLAVPVLVGLGMDELSVSIPAIPVVKARIRGLKFADLRPLAEEALDCTTAQEVRDLVKQRIGS